MNPWANDEGAAAWWPRHPLSCVSQLAEGQPSVSSVAAGVAVGASSESSALISHSQ